MGSSIKNFPNLFDDIINNNNLSVENKLKILSDFKGHVKKELVNINLIHIYFNTLLQILIKFNNNLPILSISHSSLCYLVKRVSYQSPGSINKELVNQLILHFISIQNNITNMPSNNNSNTSSSASANNFNIEKKFWLLSNKSMETIYLTVPIYVEDCLLNLFENYLSKNKLLTNLESQNSSQQPEENLDIILKNINNDNFKYLFLIIDDLTKINLQSTKLDAKTQNNQKGNNNHKNPIIFLQTFIPLFIKFINKIYASDMDTFINNTTNANTSKDKRKILIELIRDILNKYLDTSNMIKFRQQINDNNIRNVFNENNTVNDNFNNKKNINDKMTNTSQNNINNIDGKDSSISQDQQIITIENDSTNNDSASFDLDFEYDLLLNDFKSPQISNLLNQNHLKFKSASNSVNSLTNDLANLLLPFNSPKETEQNWKIRQSNIITIREKILINEKLILENKDEFVSNLKEINFITCLSKAILSLRTSLSFNACQLLKELFVILGDSLTIGLIDQIYNILKNLLSSTKKISSQMTLHILIVLFINLNEFHNKLFQNVLMLINEKSILPRNASTVLLRLFIIKFNQTAKFDNNFVYIEEWLKKGLSDAQIIVRDSMKVTFWYFYKCYPQQAKSLLLNTFTPQMKKSLESTIPLHLNIQYEKQFQSNNSSNNNSRRSSLLSPHFQNGLNNKRKFPSYAQPTQASSTLQKVNQNNNHLRSTSETIANDQYGNGNDIGIKRLRLNNSSVIRRKVSAPPNLKNINIDTNNPLLDQLDNENTNQFDLTDEINSPNSNSLIKKYLGNISSTKATSPPKPTNTSQTVENIDTVSTGTSVEDQLTNIYKYFDINENENATNALYELFTSKERNDSFLFDINKILPQLRLVMIKTPILLKKMLSSDKFVNLVPLAYLFELFSICELNIDNLLLSYNFTDSEKIIKEICQIFQNLISTSHPKNEILYYMKNRQKFFNFTLGLLFELLKNKNLNFTFNNDQFNTLLSTLFDIYGNEYDNDLYFDLLFQLYNWNKNIFTNNLIDLNLVSKKLKISNELQQRDNNFELPDNKLNSSFIIEDMDIKKEDDTDVKRYMEMTMVNPFNQKKSQTTADQSILNYVPTDNNTETIGPHISEMTKVVSVFQNFAKDENIEEESFNDIKKEEKRSDIDLSDIFGNNKSSSNLNTNGDEVNKNKENVLSGSVKVEDIKAITSSESVPIPVDANIPAETKDETTKPDGEHTVKFSLDPPKIINTEINTNYDSSEKDRYYHNNKNRESDIDMKVLEKNAIKSALKATKPATDLEIKVEDAINDDITWLTDNNSNFSVLDILPASSLTFYELSTILINSPNNVLKGDEYFDIQFKHLMKAIIRIKNGTFTMKHLIYLIEPLIIFNDDNKQLKDWLENKDGYTTLLEISLMLLQSTDDTVLIPTNMTSKSLILLQCLIIINNKLEGKDNLSSDLLSKIWDQFIILAEKLYIYNNELYKLLVEGRQLLIQFQFFNSKGITRILTRLLLDISDFEQANKITNDGQSNTDTDGQINLQFTDATTKNNGIIPTFLLETLNNIFTYYQKDKANAQEFKKNQFSEIIHIIEPYTRQTNTEWRHASHNILTHIYHILHERSDTTEQEIERMFNCLPQSNYRLIKLMNQKM